MIGSKARGNYYASIWYNQIMILLWENPTTFISMISGFLNLSPSPQTNSFFIFVDPRTLQKTKTGNTYAFLSNLIFINLGILETHHFVNFGKGGHRTIPTIRQIKSRKSWIWDRYLPENMKWKFGKFLKPRNHEAIQL